MKTSIKTNKSLKNFENLTPIQLIKVIGGSRTFRDEDFDSEVNTVRNQMKNSIQKKEVTKPAN